jgi:hypothetical protein
VLGFVFALAMLTAACSGAMPAAETSPSPTCSVIKGRPLLCDGVGEHFVVGLDPAHGWERGDWVVLDHAPEELVQTRPIALVVVIEPYSDSAKVHVLYQREPRPLNGAFARRIKKDERARLGKFVGRIAELNGGLVRIDVGKQDEALAGDVYQILSPRDHSPIGLVQLTTLDDLVAWATPIEHSEPLTQGMEAVYLRGAEAGPSSTVSADLEHRINHIEGDLGRLAEMDFKAGRLDDAQRVSEAILENARTTRNVGNQADAQVILGLVDVYKGNLVSARRRFTEALALYQQLGKTKQAEDVASFLAMPTAVWSFMSAWHAAMVAGGGVAVTGVQPGDQAEKAGLAVGDILVRYDQTRLDKVDTFLPLVHATDAAKPVTLEILRGAQKLTVQVHGGLLGITIKDLPPDPFAPPPASRP